MFDSSKRTTGHVTPPGRQYPPGSALQSLRTARTMRALSSYAPLLLLAVALMALAVFFVHDSQPAQATHGPDSHLTGLTISGTIELEDETEVTVPLLSNPPFDPHTGSYTVRVPDGLKSVTFTPTWASGVSRVYLWDRENERPSTGGATEVGHVTVSGTPLTFTSGRKFPALRVVSTQSGVANMPHYFTLQEASLAFDTTTVEARTYTAGHEISHLGLSEAETDALRLPKATGGFYNVTYEATGLPDGLWLGQGRLIQGTPTAKTVNPAEVTFTATDDAGRSVSLMFNVNVAAPVEFPDAEDVRDFKNTIIEYTVGQSEPINLTLPEARGGHGMLTYGMSYWVKETRTVDGRQVTAHWEYSINDDAPGFTFNPTTRVLSSGTGPSAPSAKAFYSVDYWAEDENGSRIIATNSITVNEAPTLPAITWPVWTIGGSVSLTLPEAVGGTRVGIGIRYNLEGVDLSALGLSFNGRTRTISGTLTTGLAESGVDLTYTATDRNGVTAESQFFVTTVSGDDAPTSAPDLSAFNAATTSGRQIVFLDWADVERATSYVVQVGADDGSFFPELVFPALAVDALPEEASMTVYDSQTDLGNDKTGHALITGLTAGDYIVRVAAANADGPSDWSIIVKFTVPAGGI